MPGRKVTTSSIQVVRNADWPLTIEVCFIFSGSLEGHLGGDLRVQYEGTAQEHVGAETRVSPLQAARERKHRLNGVTDRCCVLGKCLMSRPQMVYVHGQTLEELWLSYIICHHMWFASTFRKVSDTRGHQFSIEGQAVSRTKGQVFVVLERPGSGTLVICHEILWIFKNNCRQFVLSCFCWNNSNHEVQCWNKFSRRQWSWNIFHLIQSCIFTCSKIYVWCS